MKYIKATIYLLFGIVKAIFYWVTFLPIAIFTMPVEMWNNALYGKKKKQIVIHELDNGKIKITLPSGEVLYGEKDNKKAST